jgi:valyl-tRNA synthetase
MPIYKLEDFMYRELAKNYDPKAIEGKIYDNWLEKKYFHAEPDSKKKPFTIVIPPPNITGQLHMGHALDNTMQDILIRYKRMQGYNALWQPGTDHASIATEVKVIQSLAEKGINKHDLGREGFLEKCWEWRKEYGGRIIKQLKKLGSSCDWDRERFTMDEGCSKAVETVFVKLYNEGKIYKGKRIVNWCPVCHTSISDAEVLYQEQASHLWHIKYKVNGEDNRFIEFATTRPETMLGDTAVAVNPNDDRYKDLVGKTCHLPFVDREIPIIADEYVDVEFGTGVVKITPAHDPNDFQVGLRHDLPVINILNDDATINENGGKFAGMDRYDARKKIVEELDQMGLLVRIEDYAHNVGTHDRCGTTVEPMVKDQWFVKMDEMIKPAVKAIQDGEVKLVPPSMDKTYYNWTNNIKDWCISRQLWWGHRIPAYYCKDCGNIMVATKDNAPCECSKCHSKNIQQDEDTLDTWFSSALWPFSTLGWPDETEDLKYFFPTDVLVTGYDIIFFWVIRMIFSSYEHMGTKPFSTVMFHGLVRDAQGRKMSKSLGNGIDPLEVIDQYGTDALRFMLISGSAPGSDIRYIPERVVAARNFANKVWNASRFIMMNINSLTEAGIQVPTEKPDESTFTVADKWILSKVNELAADATDKLDKFELGVAGDKIEDFIWNEFCDWYIEMVKPRLYGEDAATKVSAIWTLEYVLTQSLKLLHPYMPFVTEEIYVALREQLGGKMADGDTAESIMVSKWPVKRDDLVFTKEEQDTELIKAAVKSVRDIRISLNVPPSKKAHIYVVSDDENVRRVFEEAGSFAKALACASDITVQADKAGIADDALSGVIPGATIFVPFADMVDVEKEKERLTKEKERLEKELERSNKMLSNENFVKKAPEKKLAEERAKQKDYEDMMEKVKQQLAHLEGLN